MQTIQENNYMEPRTARLESIGSQSSGPQTPVSASLPHGAIYTFDTRSSMESVAATSESRPTSVPGSPLYMNVSNGDDKKESKNQSSTHAAYLYLSEKYDKPPPLTLPSSPTEFSKDELSPKNLQYVTLELSNGQSSPSVRTPVSEEGRSPGYTTIDFQKTWALVQSTKPNLSLIHISEPTRPY